MPEWIQQHRNWFLLFLGCFLAVHWQEVTSPTFNVDDWALIDSAIPQASMGRPGWDLVYRLVFQGSFSPFLGWLLAAISIYGCGAVMGFFVTSLTPSWVFVLSLITALHPYQVDLFNFSFAIGLYLLPALISLLGVWMMGIAYAPGNPRSALIGLWVAGVALFGFAISIYQPTGVYGVSLLGVVLVSRALSLKKRPFFNLRSACTGIGVSGFSYLLVVHFLLASVPAETRMQKGLASLPTFFEKLHDPSLLRALYGLYLQPLPSEPPASQLMLTLLLGIIPVLAAYSLLVGHHFKKSIALLAGSACLIMLPVALFYVLEVDYPQRAMAMGNFGIGLLAVIVLSSWCAGNELLGMPRSSLARRRIAIAIISLWGSVYLFPQAVYASKLWDAVQVIERRDQALAASIIADVHRIAPRNRMPSNNFVVYGFTQPHPLEWSSVARSAFRAEWSIPAIFKQLYGVSVTSIKGIRTGRGESLANQPDLPACRPYPEPGSIQVWKGQLLVCLESND